MSSRSAIQFTVQLGGNTCISERAAFRYYQTPAGYRLPHLFTLALNKQSIWPQIAIKPSMFKSHTDPACARERDCINVVIASQVECNGECQCQFGFAGAPLPFIWADFNNPCQTPNSSHFLSDTTALSPRADRNLNINLARTKAKAVQLDKYYFPHLTDSAVKLACYYFLNSIQASTTVWGERVKREREREWLV